MFIHINDVMPLIRRALSKDPNAPIFSDPVSIKFRTNATITDTAGFYIPGIGELNIDVDANEGVVTVEIFP